MYSTSPTPRPTYPLEAPNLLFLHSPAPAWVSCSHPLLTASLPSRPRWDLQKVRLERAGQGDGMVLWRTGWDPLLTKKHTWSADLFPPRSIKAHAGRWPSPPQNYPGQVQLHPQDWAGPLPLLADSGVLAQDFLGQAFLALGEVIGGQGSRVERPLTGVPGKKCGTILLTAEELSNCRDIATMQLCANKLDKKDFFGKSDPFLVFYRSNEDGTFTICHKTEVVKNTLNPVWQPFSIPVRALCNGDYDRTVKIDVYDWDRDGSHDFIGEFTTSYRELSKAQNQFTVYEVLNPRKKCKKKKYVNSGTVTLLSFSVDSEFTFVDYIKGGTQLNFTVAIDFTASNGNPLQPTSLHYMSPYQLSAYAMALKAVGEIIQDYDSDKLFPAYGFGAKLPPEGRISHQFPLNNNDEDPNCAGIEGVLESYFQSLRTVQLYGPTYFAPVINQVARAAAKISDGSQYYVLLIITDGVISDMTQTKEAIVSASSLPMSIIIVGVGPAMFEAMEELDGDDVRVSSRGRYAERDIVQFVPFRDYVDRSGNQVLSMARLAKDVLAEIPEQLLSYMRTRDIQPRPPPPANSSPTPAPEQP
ncbi:copine-9 isoform X1 [Marmota flaviventris]|uniref:copine-9 isoform X1 n=1 Tax=Marmota flaviventris TaxID=93162 RepID=UPI000FFF792F|nr:copine-9 isoform X1 [Marmota flaviventris]